MTKPTPIQRTSDVKPHRLLSGEQLDDRHVCTLRLETVALYLGSKMFISCLFVLCEKQHFNQM